MDEIKALLSQQNIPFDPLDFLVNLVLAAVLCTLLAWAYGRFGRSLSNRERFASNFVLLGITTMVIISIVKSSLALSLGLVGALSIVRFRSAIKDPEELTFSLRYDCHRPGTWRQSALADADRLFVYPGRDHHSRNATV